MKKIAIVIGTRPEAIKLIPVYLELKKNPLCETILISTGQHKEMLQQIFSFFEVTPNHELGLMTANQGLAQITSLLLQRLDELFKVVLPDWVVVQGDTTTAMTAALTSFYHKIKVAHVEAGLRSYDNLAPYPEEVNRKIISQIADLHLAPTETAKQNLLNEKHPHVHVVGNTVIDALLMGKACVESLQDVFNAQFASIVSANKPLVLITAHRRESFGDGLKNICEAIRELAASHSECEFVFPVHLNPNISEPVNELLSGLSNIHLLKPLPYGEMIFLMSKARLILTDSGGIQEEAPALHVPFIVLRDVTERPEGIAAGCGILAGTEKNKIVSAFNSIYDHPANYDRMARSVNPYGDGTSSRQIVSLLLTSGLSS